MKAVGGMPLEGPLDHTSVRLLDDLMEFARQQGERSLSDLVDRIEARFVAVIRGEARVVASGRTDAGGSPVRPLHVPAGSAFVRPRPQRTPLDVVGLAPEGTTVVVADDNVLAAAGDASVAVATAFGEHAAAKYAAGAPLAEYLWLAEERGLGVPLQGMADLLAATIARSFMERTAVVVCGAAPAVRIWSGDRFVAGPPLPVAPNGPDDVAGMLPGSAAGELWRLIFVDPDPTHEAPAWLQGTMHRVVHLTRALPEAIAPALLALLRPGTKSPLDPTSPLFSSYIPSILLGAATPASCTGDAPSEPLPAADAPAFPAAARLRRDLSRLDVDPRALRARWDATAPAAREDFAATCLRDPALTRTMERWARAVTNRRVGLALAGGGASAFRFVPLIRRLHAAGVPIDVVSAVSGGALLGAYYCALGEKGLDLAIANGLRFQAMVAGAVADSRVIKLRVDRDLCARPLDQLEVCFVPFTTVVEPQKEPRPHAVVRGTVGDGVRFSGSAPLGFAPTEREGRRYLDGFFSSPLPARVLHYYGADLVISAICLPSPRRGNPIADWPAGDFLYHWTPLGRPVDMVTSLAFFLRQIHAEAADDSHVFIDAEKVDVNPFEPFLFFRAARIAREANEGKAGQALGDSVEEARRLWEAMVERRPKTP